jgi:hypothetical protein
MYPMTCATAISAGSKSTWDTIRHQVAFLDPAFLAARQIVT